MDRMLNLVEAAPLLGVSGYTLRVWVRQGRLPITGSDAGFFSPRPDLERFLARHRVRGDAPTRHRTGAHGAVIWSDDRSGRVMNVMPVATRIRDARLPKAP